MTLDPTPKAWSIKETTEKLDFMKIKTSFSVKKTKNGKVSHGVEGSTCKAHIQWSIGMQDTKNPNTLEL